MCIGIRYVCFIILLWDYNSLLFCCQQYICFSVVYQIGRYLNCSINERAYITIGIYKKKTSDS